MALESQPSLISILESLIPDQLPASKGANDIAIHHLNVVIFGKPNTGKTTLGSDIVAALVGKYGAANVLSGRSTRDLPALFGQPLQAIRSAVIHDKLPEKPVVVLMADDMTKAIEKLKRSERAYWLDRWYDIRGELAALGMRQGLAVMITTTHRFYGAPLDMRADVDLLLARSTGTPGTFEARFIQRTLQPAIYDQLRKYEVGALHDLSLKGWTGWGTKQSSGLVYVSPVSNAMPALPSSAPAATPSVSSMIRPWWVSATNIGIGLGLWGAALLWFLNLMTGWPLRV